MGRPRPNLTEPVSPEPGGYAEGSSPPPPPPSYPPPPPPSYPPPSMTGTDEIEATYRPPPSQPAEAAVPYPPPNDQHPPPYVDGTPVTSFPPAATHNIPETPSYPQQIGDPWSSGLFDCEMNENNAIMTAFFPCVTFGQIAEMMDEGQTSCTLGSFMYVLMVPALLTCWVLGSNYRQKMRQKYNLVEAPYEDWAVHLFCPCCALCQEFRELKKRGVDPSLGWMGHLAMQQQLQTQTAPPINQSMDR